MSNEIKNEFKDFIATLSTEICKEVLIEELENINTSLNNTSEKYDKLYENYKLSIGQITQELSRLDNSTKTMNSFTNSINLNSKAVNESLAIIKNGQEKSLQDILNKNTNALEKYKTDIQKLNANERNEFIMLLNKNLNEYSKKYMNELANIVNGSKMNQTLENTNEINKLLKSTNSQINSGMLNINKLSKEIILKNEEECKVIYNKLSNGIDELQKQLQLTKREVKDNDKKLENKIIELEEEIQSKNKIIIITNISILVMTILLFFIK
ncbi:hypothetical protein EAI30_08950 [Romboutsia ilealis]|nr:hypothetical protein [Romboutsia ilealis]